MAAACHEVAIAATLAGIHIGLALKGPLPPAARFVDLQYLRAAGVE
jgi:hypothetical protein